MQKLWTKFENSLANAGITKSRIRNVKSRVFKLEEQFGKPLSDLCRSDVEAWAAKLHRNEIRKADGKIYSGDYKATLKKVLRQFLKWHKGNGEDYPDEVRWLRTKVAKDERPEEKITLTVEETVKLANSFQKIEYKLIVLLLLDSGFRIGELLSMKKCDLTWDRYGEIGEKCFWVTCRDSKTATRRIPVNLFPEEYKSFINSSYFQNLQSEDLIFSMQYNTVRRNLWERSQVVLGKHISPHCLRHSSATLYAKLLNGNMNMLAQRFGWEYDSKQLATYIRKSGAYLAPAAKLADQNDLMRLREETSNLREKINRMEPVFELLLKALENKTVRNHMAKHDELLKRSIDI